MKRLIYILLLALSSQFAMASSALMEKANKQYSEQKFAEAVKSYEQIVNGGFESAQLFFNLGNAYYKTGQIPKAILFYEKAKLLNPHDDDINYNLKLANQHIVDKIESLPQVFFTRWWNSIVRYYSADSWAWSSLSAFALFALLLGVFLLTRSGLWKRVSFWLGSFAFIFSCFAFYFAVSQKKMQTQKRSAIVFSPSVTVKSTPAESGTKLFVIHEGIKVQLTDSVSNWKEIKLPDGNKGWLPDSCVVKI
ncbi:tetratricopeptide repeat protein [Prolixibacteraceae bacterium JC049]|nr:tetratricopeptide repeat protein [Prolixibacteraceae bacterium JC049]